MSLIEGEPRQPTIMDGTGDRQRITGAATSCR